MLSREKILSFTFAAIVAFIVTFSMKMLFLEDYKEEINDTKYKKAVTDIPKTEAVVKVIREPTVKVLVSKKKIQKGTTLSLALVEWKDWPKGLIGKNYIATENGKSINESLKADAIIGLKAALDIDVCMPLTVGMFFKATDVTESDKDIQIREGMRAFTLPVDQTSVANQMFFPGDVVDIYISTIKCFYRNVKILALDDKGSIEEIQKEIEVNEKQSKDKSSSEWKKRYKPKTVTLELSTAQIGQIVPNIPPGGITLILISDVERREFMQHFRDQYLEQAKMENNYEVPLQVQTYSAKKSNEHMELVGTLVASPEEKAKDDVIAVTDPVTGEVEEEAEKYTVAVIKRDKTTLVEIPEKNPRKKEEEKDEKK